jgi:hypothetical protein
MSDRLLVGTRKGLFQVRRGGGRWGVSAPAFLGDPVSMVLADKRDGTLYAALALGHFGVKLRRSVDGGASWEEVAAPAYPKATDGTDGPSVSLIWELVAGGADEPGVLWAGTIPGGLFRSTDRGASWQLNDALWDLPERKRWSGGGYNEPGLHSICVDPRDARRLAVGISTGGVWTTRDAGASWQLCGRGMYAEYMPPDNREDPVEQDVHRLVQCPARPEVFWVQHHNGVFRSTDGTASWSDVSAIKPAKFGFPVVVHPREPDAAWFVPAVKDECRVPVDAKLVVARTRDGGRSFDVLREGLPQANAFDLIYRHGLALDESGERLAIGSTTGNLWLSENGGDSWQLVAGNLPPIACVRFG